MDRRRFLLLLAAGLAGAGVTHGAEHLAPAAAATDRSAPRPEPAPHPAATPGPAAPVVDGGGLVPADPPAGVVGSLPGPGAGLALTIDDGVSEDVVRAYAQLAADT